MSGKPGPDAVDAVAAKLPASRQHRPISRRARAEFLEGLRGGWSVRSAAERAGRDRRRFYQLATDDPEFRQQWQEALDAGTDVLEDLLHRTALEGWTEEERNGAGEVVRTRTRWTPQTLITALKGRRPEKYSEGVRVAVTSVPAAPAREWHVNLTNLAEMVRQDGMPARMVEHFDRLAAAQGEIVDAEAVELPPARELKPAPSESSDVT